MSLPIRARLTMWYVALLMLIIALLGAFLTSRLRTDLIGGIDQSLETRAAQISLGFRGQGEGEFQDVSNSSLAGLPRLESAAQLVGPDGSVKEYSGDAVALGLLISRAQLAAALGGQTVRSTVTAGPDLEPFRVLAVSLPQESGGNVIVVAASLDEVNRSAHRLVILILIAGPAAALVAGLGGWWIARRALAPVSRMTGQAATIDLGRLGERVQVPRATDELRRLALTLNTMLDRLQRGVEEKRRFVADASHELRTPLAVMRSELDVTLRDPGLAAAARDVLASVSEEVERMTRIVEDLLTLARIDEGSLQLLLEPMHLKEVASGAVASIASLAAGKGVRVEVGGDDVGVVADRARLEQVVTNLAGNAVKYSGRGSDVGIHVWRNGVEAGLTVRDAGPGIPADLLPRIFDRFVRADAARSSDGGSGLGLAICREIIQAHGGRMWVESRLGSGSAFSFALPTVAEQVAHPFDVRSTSLTP